MSFSSIGYAFFFPLVLLLHWALPRRASWQNAFLLAASWLFYFTWNPKLLPLLLVTTAVDYALAVDIERHRESPRRMRVALGLSLAFNLGTLGYFKYAGFFAASLDALLQRAGMSPSLPVLHLALPLGISFFTFQKIGYVLDVYDGRIAACRSPLRFATFVAFFPQLAAGPIVRGDELLPQLEAPRSLDVEAVREGAGRFFAGFIKKAFIADYVAATLADPVFDHPARFSTLGLWLGLFGYAAQVYCDFSGYTDMALGSAKLLGITLPENFNHPFLSKSLIEFWRRWHITLNRWWFDYIYGPLTTGDGWFRGRLDAAFVVVFLVSGLWHGPRWTFVAWGLLHGLGLVAHRHWDEYYRSLCRRDRAWVARRRSAGYQLAAWALTQGFFLVSLVPFRATTLRGAGAYALGLVTPRAGLTLPDSPPRLRTVNLALCFAALAVYHLVELERGRPWRDRFFALPAPVRGAVYGLAVAYLFVFVPVAAGAFIYAQF